MNNFRRVVVAQRYCFPSYKYYVETHVEGGAGRILIEFVTTAGPVSYVPHRRVAEHDLDS
jgi:hypothetical protein